MTEAAQINRVQWSQNIDPGLLLMNEYQAYAACTAKYKGRGFRDGVVYCAMGLGGEAGELINKLKKINRDDFYDHRGYVEELGDILWYVSQLAVELQVTLGGLAQMNIVKLSPPGSRQRWARALNPRLISLDEYQLHAAHSARYSGRVSKEGLIFCALGLFGKIGKLLADIKKIAPTEPYNYVDYAEKLGAILWYVSQLASELEISLGEVARINVEKLARRAAANKINGQGDYR